MGRSESRRHRVTIAAAVAVVAAMGVVPATGATPASSHSSCPPAESLVPGTTWHHHTLAKGVTVAEGTAQDSRGSVNMHVLRVDLTQPTVSVQPLVHSLAQRLPLSTLAAGHPRLVAASNTGYFDFDFGAPTVPFVSGGSPRVLSTTHQTVVGIGANGHLEAAQVWLSSTVTAGKSTHSVVAVNEVSAPDGVAVFDSRWGSARLPSHSGTVSRPAVNGSLGAQLHRGATVPKGGFVLQARGRAAASWLGGLANGTKMSLTSAVKSNAASPLSQAYGVGVQLVAQAGVAKTGFSCSSSNTRTPARTAIGFAKNGKQMIMAFVADHPHTSTHGLDEDQMSKLMVQLGVQQAYAFDGSGSTELLAKLPRTPKLTMQTYPADGAERPMPLGMGISVKPVRHHHKKKH
jgi:hypothetical protein